MVQCVDDVCDVFGHINFAVPRTFPELRIAVNEVCRKDPLDIAFFICFVKGIQPFYEETEG